MRGHAVEVIIHSATKTGRTDKCMHRIEQTVVTGKTTVYHTHITSDWIIFSSGIPFIASECLLHHLIDS